MSVDASARLTYDRDARFLRRRRRPQYEAGRNPVRIVDLFAGCGGLTLGLAEAARRQGRGLNVRLAVDSDEKAAIVYKHNFPAANTMVTAVEDIFCCSAGQHRTAREETICKSAGRVDILVGGPPCQGSSDLNNHTRRFDKRNELYLHMARAAEVLKPAIVLIENVPAVEHDRGRVIQRTYAHLERLRYQVGCGVVDLYKLGVAQRRRRHVLIATRLALPHPSSVFERLTKSRYNRRDLAWAFQGLGAPNNGDRLHISSRMSQENTRRLAWLVSHKAHDLPDHMRPRCHRLGGHSYRSVYGRLWWNQPSQTITTGFSSMGQGRYVHPNGKRTLTPREAARLQFFPDFFDFSVVDRRSAWAQMIGNAVPPKLTSELGKMLMEYLD